MVDLSRPCDSCGRMIGGGFYCCTKCKIYFCFYCTLQLPTIPKTIKKDCPVLKDLSPDPKLREVYDKRQIALKWILVTCFGYLGFKNAKFGTVDGHIAVCAFGREALLNAAHMAEENGFQVIHGIVDSLWLKKTRCHSGRIQNALRKNNSAV